MRKQVSPSQLFTQTNLKSVVFNSKYLVFNILKNLKYQFPLQKYASSLLLDCKNTFDHFFTFYFFSQTLTL
ncbi:hypothetical protein C2R94_01375 [Helicobacter pylori]|nr:hypothetical protein C2R94_01375 [Helicobacter pylori]